MDYTDISTTSDLSTSASMYQVSPIFSMVYLVMGILAIVGMWKVFAKAGQPGWAAIIPFYNIYIMLKIAGRPGWWLILLLIPFVNIVILLLVSLDIAKAFGKSGIFGIVGLFLFSFIGYLLLGFGDAQYVGSANGGTPTTPTSPEPAPAPPVATESTPQA